MIREIRYIFHFHSTVFPTYPENHNVKEGLYFLNQGTKTKFFGVVKVKNHFNMMHISFLLKQLCWCCLDRTFVSLILLESVFVIHFSYMLFSFPCIDILRIVLQLLKVVLNLCIINYFNNIVASQLI